MAISSGQQPRITLPTAMVLRLLLADPQATHYGFAVSQATGLKSGTIYPILNRLESAGWLTGTWETIDPREVGRPPRRYYRLTEVGERQAREGVERIRSQLGPFGSSTS